LHDRRAARSGGLHPGMSASEQRIALERTLEPGRRFQLRDQVALVLLEHHAHFLIEFLEFFFLLLNDLIDFVELFGRLERGLVDLVDASNPVAVTRPGARAAYALSACWRASNRMRASALRLVISSCSGSRRLATDSISFFSVSEVTVRM
jgi:hypothetical protein